ncbi:MAG TPA: PfkB family carbohydrate kinase, partial [Saprospiraceae bacterium]|nr:PfkB family carbohydrate kinase [Saprospiraceae bacterium]
GKGFCSKELVEQVIYNANFHNIPVYVDPKGKEWEKYRGASLIKPNASELEEWLGASVRFDEQSLLNYFKQIAQLNISNIVISRAKDGLTLVAHNGFNHFLAPTIDVYDVSGAGDTVMAVLVYGYTQGMPLRHALELAVKAGSFVVTKSRTYAINLEELNTLITKA